MCCFFILLFNLLFHLNISAANAKCVPITLPVKHFQTTKYIVTVFYIFIFGLDQSWSKLIKLIARYEGLATIIQSNPKHRVTGANTTPPEVELGETFGLERRSQRWPKTNEIKKKTFEWKGQPIWRLPTAVLVTLGYFRTNCNLYFRLYLGFSLRGPNWHGLKDLVS